MVLSCWLPLLHSLPFYQDWRFAFAVFDDSFQPGLWSSRSSCPQARRCCLYLDAFAFRISDSLNLFGNCRWLDHHILERIWGNPSHTYWRPHLWCSCGRSLLCSLAWRLGIPWLPMAYSKKFGWERDLLQLDRGQHWTHGLSWSTCWGHS